MLRENQNMYENNLLMSLAIEMTKTNRVDKIILIKRLDILKGLFSSEYVLNNIIRINCDCNAVEILKRLNVHSMKMMKVCSNIGCPKKEETITFPSLLLNLTNKNIRVLQNVVNEYIAFEPTLRNCIQEKCHGTLRYKKTYNELIFITMSSENLNHTNIPHEVKSCRLNNIPNIIEINKKTIYLRGVIGYYPPLTNTIAIGHYVCFAKRKNVYWEVSYHLLIIIIIIFYINKH